MPNACNLTSKDLSVVEDQLVHIATSCRVAQHYATQFSDQQLKTVAASVAQHHRQQYDAIYAFLNGCQ